MSRWTVSWFIEFAISGTLALAFGLISLTMAVWIGRVAHVLDRVFISLSEPAALPGTLRRFRFLLVAWAHLARLSTRLLPADGGVGMTLAAFRSLRSPATAWGSASGER